MVISGMLPLIALLTPHMGIKQTGRAFPIHVSVSQLWEEERSASDRGNFSQCCRLMSGTVAKTAEERYIYKSNIYGDGSMDIQVLSSSLFFIPYMPQSIIYGGIG